MPEGPSIIIAREILHPLKGRKILEADGSAKIDMDRIVHKKVDDLKSWGKHFLICFPGFFLRIHFMMFGTYLLNDSKKLAPRLHLAFRNGEANFYTCSVRLIEGSADDYYDWEADVMSDHWNPKKARKALTERGAIKICDALLDQEIFSGVGNIIKNEVLFRVRIHPESTVDAIPAKQLNKMVGDARTYSFEFYKWRKINQLKKHWMIYNKKICPRCNIPVIKKYLGKTKRMSCFCPNCQILYT